MSAPAAASSLSSHGEEARSETAPVVEAVSVYRFFHVGGEQTLALQGVSVSVPAGALVAVVGPSGSGKSTLLGCVAGLDEPDGGIVRVTGKTMTGKPETARAALRARAVGVLFQSANLFEHLDVAANLALVRSLAGTSVGDPGELLARVGIEHRARAYPSQLSGGEAARAGLAVALANDPPVLLADEPTGELDTATEATVLTLLRATAERGTGVLVASHSPAVAAAADVTITLRDGRVTS